MKRFSSLFSLIRSWTQNSSTLLLIPLNFLFDPNMLGHFHPKRTDPPKASWPFLPYLDIHYGILFWWPLIGRPRNWKLRRPKIPLFSADIVRRSLELISARIHILLVHLPLEFYSFGRRSLNENVNWIAKARDLSTCPFYIEKPPSSVLFGVFK